MQAAVLVAGQSTMIVIALLVARIEGRQMCSSTPRVFTP